VVLAVTIPACGFDIAALVPTAACRRRRLEFGPDPPPPLNSAAHTLMALRPCLQRVITFP